MSETFYTILTTVGQAKIANAQVTGQNVNLTEIAVGDGGGSYYNPVQTQTSLKNEVWRGNIGSVQVDEENPNWIVIEGVIPATVGGFFVREVGIFDDAGDMIAIGKYPETYKPVTTEGSAKDLYIRMIIEVTNASAVQLKIDPSVIIASRKYVDDKVAPVEQKANQNAASILQLQQQVNAHLNENATEAHNGISILNDNITVTVGDNGDFSTINEALNYLTTKYPAYKSVGNVKATIKLLSGFVMSEQVLVRGLNLGWIEIVGEDAETTIERSALTINFTIDDYGFNSFPAFGVSKGGTLPIVGQLFVMDDSGNRVNRHGIMAVDNSRASILTGCGVQNAGAHGIYALEASIINANEANASNAGEHGIYALQASIINANEANASNAGNHGIYASQSSTIEAWGADASGAGGRGVFANQASIINAIAVNARKGEVDSAEDIYVANGSIIKIVSTGNNQTIGGTNQAINTLTGNGIIFG